MNNNNNDQIKRIKINDVKINKELNIIGSCFNKQFILNLLNEGLSGL